MKKAAVVVTAVTFLACGVIQRDAFAGRIYWTDNVAGKVQRAVVDDANTVDTLVTGLTNPQDITLDLNARKMYWTDHSAGGDGVIKWADLDGNNDASLPIGGLTDPRGIDVDPSGGKIYWTESFTDTIQRANLDGSNVQDLPISGLSDPRGIAVDPPGGKIYWADQGTREIQRANLDGTNVELLVMTGANAPFDIALDLSAGMMYWTEFGADVIWRASLEIPFGETPGTRTDVETLNTDPNQSSNPFGIALDVASGEAYWTTHNDADIWRADLDDGDFELLPITGLSQPFGIAFDPILGDINGDGVVGVGDLGILGAQWGGPGGTPSADIAPHPGGNGIVNVGDLAFLAVNWSAAGGGSLLGGGATVPLPDAGVAGLTLLGTGLRRRGRYSHQ